MARGAGVWRVILPVLGRVVPGLSPDALVSSVPNEPGGVMSQGVRNLKVLMQTRVRYRLRREGGTGSCRNMVTLTLDFALTCPRCVIASVLRFERGRMRAGGEALPNG